MSEQQQNQMYNDYKSNVSSMANTYSAFSNRNKLSPKQKELKEAALAASESMDKYINGDFQGSQRDKLKGILDDTSTNPVQAVKDGMSNYKDYLKEGGLFGGTAQNFLSDAAAGAREQYNDVWDNINTARELIRDEIDNAPLTQGMRKLDEMYKSGELEQMIRESPEKAKELLEKAKEGYGDISEAVKEGYANASEAVKKGAEELPGKIKEGIENFPENAKKGFDNSVKAAKNGVGKLKDSATDKISKIDPKEVKDKLNDLSAKNLTSFKDGAKLAGDLGLPGTDAIGAAMDAAKNAKSAVAAGKLLAHGSIDPAGAVAMVAKDFLEDLANDPKKAARKILVMCSCIISPVCAVLYIVLLPFVMLLAMFFTMLSNDSSKHDGPRASDSWIYKYSEADYKDIMAEKISANPDNTYIISHNASYQSGKDEKDLLAEDSEEMQATSGYTNDPIYLYEEASLSSKKIISQFRYGDAVVAHIASGATKPSEVGGFLPVEVEEASSGRKTSDLATDNKDGLDNENLKDVVKNIYYIEKRLVYKQKRPDVRMEYTLRDEYQVMAMALRKALLRKQSESLEEGNKKIDEEAAKYNKNITEGDIVNGEKYKLTGASMVKDENGNIIGSLSEITDPNRDVYDAASSRSALSASANSQAAMGQDVATILSGYAASKADSLPDEGYYKMLDKTMKEFLKNSLSLEDSGLESSDMSRPLSEKTTIDYSVLKVDGVSGKILREYNENTMAGLSLKRYDRIGDSSGFFLHPNSKKLKYDVKAYEGVYLKKDLKKSSGAMYIERPNGRYVFFSPWQYAMLDPRMSLGEAKRYARAYDNVASVEKIKVVGDNKKDVSYDYKQYRSRLSITALDANEIVWQFFEKDKEGFYPMVHKDMGVKDLDNKDVKIHEMTEWRDKLAQLRRIAYYQQELSYIFDNSGLENKGYIKAKNPLYGYANENEFIWFEIVRGVPGSEAEQIEAGQMKEYTGDTDIGEVEAENGKVTNWRRRLIENHSASKLVNSAGVKAKKGKLLWFIPFGYKQEYRRADAPDLITKERLDENGEYIRKFSRGSSMLGEGTGGFIAAGDAVVPVKGWENKITSTFKMRMHPILKVMKLHAGVDIGVPTGTSVYAVLDGKVIGAKMGYNKGAGNYVKIDHGNGLHSIYMHNSVLLVKTGQEVKAGQEIAKSGNSGGSTGPHVHFQLNQNGTPFDPVPWLKSHTTISSGGVNPNPPSTPGTPGTTPGTDPATPGNPATPGTDPATPGTPATPGAATNEAEEPFDPNRSSNREFVIASVGNKMDYWYDNIMMLFDKEDASAVNTNGGQSVVDVALSYLGNAGGVYFKNAYKGTPGDKTTQVYTPGDPSKPGYTFNWCAAFVSVVMKEAGYPGFSGHGGMVYSGTATSTTKEEALAPWALSCDIYAKFAEEKGQLKPGDGSYIPKPGDLILYINEKDGGYKHIGIVVSADNNSIKTVEGNTSGPGAQDEGGWKGCVNTKERRYSNLIKLIDIPYPDNNSLESVMAKHAASILGTNSNTVDEYGRIGIGLWHGEKARKLLNDIKNVNESEVQAIIAESAFGEQFKQFLDGSADMTADLKDIVSKVLKLPQSESIQQRMMKARTKEIDSQAKSLYSASWDKLDGKSKAYFIIGQVIMDAYGEPNWISSRGVNEIINTGASKEANLDTYIADMSDFVERIPLSKQGKFLEYKDWKDIAAVNNEKAWSAFYKPLGRMMKKLGTMAQAIPSEDVSFGMGNGKTWVIPPGYGSTKSYMGNHLLTARGTEQYRLKQFTTTGQHEVGMIDGRMTVAMYVGAKGKPKGFGEVGDKIDIQLNTGTILKCVVADAKNLEKDKRPGDKTNFQYGVHSDGSMVEFVLNTQVRGRYPKPAPNFTTIFPGDVVKVVNLGPIGK